MSQSSLVAMAEQAVTQCPFLASLARQQGPAFALHIAQHPLKPFRAGPVLEEADDFAATFTLFHGSAGVVPLQRTTATVTAVPVISDEVYGSQERAAWARGSRPAVPCPAAASISLSGFGFLPGAKELFGLGKPRQRKRKPSTGKQGQSSASQPAASQPPALEPGGAQGQCPLRGLAKPLGGLLAFSAKGQYKCPEAVVRMRAAVARLKPVRLLRPQALPVKLLALGAFTGVVNLPSGVARVHVEKFSPGWFLAVHATIPFIAMLRKAVVMPKWAIAYTVGSAVLGQIMGARLERQRLQGGKALLLPVMCEPVSRRSRAASAQRRTCRQELLSAVGSSASAVAVL